MKVKDVAKICHDANKSYCETLGDTTQPTWEKAPDWQKSSAIAGVLFHLDHPESTPEDSHNSWLKQKEAEGWSYGIVKDATTKQHPCYVAYNMLPENQRAKDFLFKNIIEGLRGFVELE